MRLYDLCHTGYVAVRSLSEKEMTCSGFNTRTQVKRAIRICTRVMARSLGRSEVIVVLDLAL